MPPVELMGGETIALDRLVNVSSVPQRSPFRYPGGKTWLVPLIRKWLQHLSFTPRLFVEPFTGGGIAGLTVAFERLADHVFFVELDPDVASVWQTILGTTSGKLAQRIKEFQLSQESVAACLGSEPRSNLDRAFQTILRNRVQHGGILAPGASLMREGENGKGLGSRWYPETLARRILAINSIRDRISFLHGDGLKLLSEKIRERKVVFFIDPPYTVTGRRLYAHSELDHGRLFKILAESDCEFLMTYDKSDEIESLAKSHGFSYKEILMQGRLNKRKTELVITKDQAWVEPSGALLPFA